jgi:hypothetical protein
MEFLQKIQIEDCELNVTKLYPKVISSTLPWFGNLGNLCGLVVRVPGYTTVKYCVCCEVRTEFIYVM